RSTATAPSASTPRSCRAPSRARSRASAGPGPAPPPPRATSPALRPTRAPSPTTRPPAAPAPAAGATPSRGPPPGTHPPTAPAHIHGTNLVFSTTRAPAGHSTGSGVSTDPGGSTGGLQRRTADGLAGAAAIQIESSATLKNVAAVGNGAVGGNASGQAGSGE